MVVIKMRFCSKRIKKRITFDIKLNTKYGIMFYIYFKRYKSSSEINTVDIGKAHDLLRRCNR